MFSNIPGELIIYHIIPNLNPQDCLKLSHSCKYFNNIINNNLSFYVYKLHDILISYNNLSPREFLANDFIKKVKLEYFLETGRIDNLLRDIYGYGTIDILIKGKIYRINNIIHIYGPLLIQIKTNTGIYFLKANFKVVNLLKQELYGNYSIQICNLKTGDIFTSLETYINSGSSKIICILYSPLTENYTINLVINIKNSVWYSYFYIYTGGNLYDTHSIFNINDIQSENDWNNKIKLIEKKLSYKTFEKTHLIIYIENSYEYNQYVYNNEGYIFQNKYNYLMSQVKPTDKYNYLFRV